MVAGLDLVPSRSSPQTYQRSNGPTWQLFLQNGKKAMIISAADTRAACTPISWPLHLMLNVFLTGTAIERRPSSSLVRNRKAIRTHAANNVAQELPCQ